MAYSYDHMPHKAHTVDFTLKIQIGTQSRYYIAKLFSYTAVTILFSQQMHVTKLTLRPTCSLHPLSESIVAKQGYLVRFVAVVAWQ